MRIDEDAKKPMTVVILPGDDKNEYCDEQFDLSNSDLEMRSRRTGLEISRCDSLMRISLRRR